jgi:hypothetical protein
MTRSLAWRRPRYLTAAVTAVMLLVVPLPELPAQAAGGAPAAGKPVYNPPVYRGKLWKPRTLELTPSVGGHSLPASAGKRLRASFRPPREPDSVPAVPYRVPSRIWWPSGSGTAAFDQTVPVRMGRITGEATRALTRPQRAGALPITVTDLGVGLADDDQASTATGASAAVQVSLAPRRVARADGVSGLLFRVSGGAGRLLVRLNYSKFARNYGGSWASRLRLVELPPCALITPGAPGCRTPMWVPGSNVPPSLTKAGRPARAAGFPGCRRERRAVLRLVLWLAGRVWCWRRRPGRAGQRSRS